MHADHVRPETQLRIVARLAGVGGWGLALRPLRFMPSPEWLFLHDCRPSARPSVIDVLRLVDAADRRLLERNLRRCARAGDSFEMVLATRTFRNRHVYMRLVAEPEFDDIGRVHYIHGACQEVTAQVEHERELAEHRLRLQELVDQRTGDLRTFSYALAHDLRAPVSAIAGFSQVTLERFAGALPPAAQRYLGRIVANAQKAEALIEGMLRLVGAAQAPLERRPVDLGAMASMALEQLAAQEPQRWVEAVVQPGLLARGDPRLLASVVDNLVGNAWKFTAPRSPAVIEVGRAPDGAFFVRDNGVGFDPAEAQQLFEPLRRLANAAGFEGTGIGLASASRIVRRHGGAMWAESQPEAGATFWFTLPG